MITCCICGKEYVTPDNIMVYGCKSCQKGNDRGRELTKKLKVYDPTEEKPVKKVKKKK